MLVIRVFLKLLAQQLGILTTAIAIVYVHHKMFTLIGIILDEWHWRKPRGDGLPMVANLTALLLDLTTFGAVAA